MTYDIDIFNMHRDRIQDAIVRARNNYHDMNSPIHLGIHCNLENGEWNAKFISEKELFPKNMMRIDDNLNDTLRIFKKGITLLDVVGILEYLQTSIQLNS